MLLLIIASAETLIDKSLQGLQTRLNDRFLQKTGAFGKRQSLLHYMAFSLSLLLVAPHGGSFFVGHLSFMCSMYISNDELELL